MENDWVSRALVGDAGITEKFPALLNNSKPSCLVKEQHEDWLSVLLGLPTFDLE